MFKIKRTHCEINKTDILLQLSYIPAIVFINFELFTPQ